MSSYTWGALPNRAPLDKISVSGGATHREKFNSRSVDCKSSGGAGNQRPVEAAGGSNVIRINLEDFELFVLPKKM